MAYTPPIHSYPVPSAKEVQQKATPPLLIVVCVVAMIGLAFAAAGFFIKGEPLLGVTMIVAIVVLVVGIWYLGSPRKRP
jgi:hypothetical protein